MRDNLDIALIQFDIVWENPKENRRILTEKINTTSSTTDVVILPEMFTTGFSMNPKELAETIDGKTINWMKNRASEKQVAIIGSLIIKEEEKYYNCLIFAYPNGKIEMYDKRHLFTYGGEDKEYTAGNKRLIVDYKGWKICPMICYDLRFPVWSRYTNDYDILIYIANWPKPRINAWNTLLKARSIENMCYTVGVNRVGVDGNDLAYVGYSQVLDMLGNELVFSENKDVILEVSLNKNKLIDTRKKFQFLNDKDSFSIKK